MFLTAKHNIVFIAPNECKYFLVSGRKKIIKSDSLTLAEKEEVWTSDILSTFFSKIGNSFKKYPLRLLVSDSLSYFVKLTIPEKLADHKERNYIADKLPTLIPENFSDWQWDYKELTTKSISEYKDVAVFAPVKNVYLAFSKAVSDLGLSVEAVEPEMFAKLRDKNPVLGLTMKKDLKGSDAQVLNLTINT